MPALLGPGAWGCGAAVALAAAILASQSDVGVERLQGAFSTVYAQERLEPGLAPNLAVAERPAAVRGETQRLTDVVRSLTTERERLRARLAALERSLPDTTGAITTAPAPQRIVAPERRTVPEQVAAAGVKFGVDLGAAANMEMLRAQWAVAQTNYTQLFEGLHPLAGVVESRPGAQELRLIVGPLLDIAAAAKLCAALTSMHAFCRTAVFDGQKLALNDVAVEDARAPVSRVACAGNPNALGTSRVLEVNADEFARIGVMQYEQSLPLADHEVVLTFDDGPLPPYTDHVLAALAAECVKATYFMVGGMANTYPDAARRVYNDGHTIGTHSQHHFYTLGSMSPQNAAREIDAGFASVAAALGDAKAVAPFFRFPGLIRVASVEKYLAGHSIMTWSADLDADDWRKIGAPEVLHRALSRLEARGRGVILLHDIQPATALMLPVLLKELKRRGYHVVQVVPAGTERPQLLPVAAPDDGRNTKQGWPRVAGVAAAAPVE
jgi:peptidoglycan/xylan/chitin deacetylase (PgdA/CDA1 family)